MSTQDDFDRDEDGQLTDEGRTQLVEWSQKRGLTDPPADDDIYTLAELLNGLAPLVTEGLTDHPITVQYADRLIGPVTGMYTADGAITLVVENL